MKSPELNVGSIFFYSCSYLYMCELTFMSRGGRRVGSSGTVSWESCQSTLLLLETTIQHLEVCHRWVFLRKASGHVRGDRTKVVFFWGGVGGWNVILLIPTKLLLWQILTRWYAQHKTENFNLTKCKVLISSWFCRNMHCQHLFR